jgi:hypothetical protein
LKELCRFLLNFHQKRVSVILLLDVQQNLETQPNFTLIYNEETMPELKLPISAS